METTSSAGSDASHRVCVIHFEGKDGELRELTSETVNRILERRKEWLSLPSSYKAFTEVAKKSFEFIHETDDLNPENIAKTYCFHPACYRSFTDKSKLDRAKTTLTNAADRKRVADDNTQTICPRPEKVTRTTRQSFPARSSNVLPDICLICKRHGPIYITDKVYRVLLYLFMCFCNINLFTPKYFNVSIKT